MSAIAVKSTIRLIFMQEVEAKFWRCAQAMSNTQYDEQSHQWTSLIGDLFV